MSITLRIFNFIMKLFSNQGIGKLHLADDKAFAEGFVEHGKKMDRIVSHFVSNITQPVISTEHKHWIWVGDPLKEKRHILYIHGGGFAIHLPSTYRYWADRLSKMNNAAVLVVDYPLAPSHPYPAGLNDCFNAYRWMVEDQKIDPSSIIIGGDSGGGNLAMAILLKIKEAKLPYPACTFVLSPCLDVTLSGDSNTDNEKTELFAKPAFLKRIGQQYVPSGNYTDAMVSPLFGDFSGVSPVQLQASNHELLRDDSIRFYEKFKNEVTLELELWDHTPHCHQIFGFLPESKVARDKIQSFIARYA